MKSNRILVTMAAMALLTTASQSADYVKGYSRGGGSQLLGANGGAGTTLFVDQAQTGGGDMTADGGNPTWGWEVDGSSSWIIGDRVEFTGIAMPIWANDPTTDGTGNTQSATHRIRIYSCGVNNVFDGAGTDTLIETVDVNFGLADAGADEYYVNFDTPAVWASADSTSFYFYIQAISTGDGTAMRFKTGAPSATSRIKNRTNGAGLTVGGATHTSLSVAGIVNRRTWFGDDEDVISPTSSDWDATSMFWNDAAAVYSDGVPAVFDENFDGISSNVNLTDALAPASVSVSNSAGGPVPEYEFSGIGSLTGSTGIARTGDGTLTVSNSGTNDYTGGTFIGEGTLKLGKEDALSTATSLTIGSKTGEAVLKMNGFDQTISSLNGGGSNIRKIVNGGATTTTLTVADGGSYAGQIGNGDVAATDDDNNMNLVKTGAGELNLVGGNNSYNGTTTITGGTLRISADSGLGSPPLNRVNDSIVLDGGTLRTHMAVGTGGSFEIDSNRLITLGAGGGAIQGTTPSGAWLATYNGVISGPGSLTKTFAQSLTLGGLNTYGGDTVVTGGKLIVNGTAIPDGSKLVLDGGKVESSGTEVVDSLFFGTEQQVAGTWGAADSGADNIDDVRFVGIAGVVWVANGPPDDPYGSWAAENITDINAAAPAGFDDDADNDGVNNGLEFLLGGNPLVPDSSIAPAVTINNVGDLIFTYIRQDEARDVTTEYSSGPTISGSRMTSPLVMCRAVLTQME